jgi:hypothetical protein
MGNDFRGKFYSLIAVLFVVGCGKPVQDLGRNFIAPTGQPVERAIGENSKPYLVMDSGTLTQHLTTGEILSSATPEGSAALKALAASSADVTPLPAADATVKSLLLGFPIGLLGEHYVFGGVITKVSDKKSDKLGNLKLTDLTPIHVRPIVASAGAGKYAFALVGCIQKCEEGSDEDVLVSVPVLAVDPTRKLVIMDIAPLGNSLNFIQMLDPTGAGTELKTKTNQTAAFDYSLSTLVFDVVTTMVPVKAVTPAPADTTFTVRWYLRLDSTFDPAFVARGPTDGIGFFQTERGVQTRIQRFALPKKLGGTDGGSVHYYIKGVPKQFQPAFQSAFDEWNGQFFGLLRKKLLTYEFVDATDPRYNQLVTGDVRYNIVEWDTENLATYGGLGPSMANQFTGEILSANVLVQGPTVVAIYSKWFNVSKVAREMREAGDVIAADALLKKTSDEISAVVASRESAKLQLSFAGVPFRVTSQFPALQDPLFQKDGFDELPAGIGYDEYMFGYFHDMVTHELGHNLGLRHNFRGNLGAALVPSLGAVSRSIMEYLNRNFRHLDRVGPYDAMAIAYGYTGLKPHQTNLYCTDEQVGGFDNPKLSAECSRDDATADPFRYFESRLNRSLRLLTAYGTADAPVWNTVDMERELGIALTGLGLYASSADSTSADWTNFGFDLTRPTGAVQIKDYVLQRLKLQLCSTALDATLALKTDASIKQTTADNIKAVRASAADTMLKLKAFSSTEMACTP